MSESGGTGSAPPAEDPLVGSTLAGRYRIVQKLGEGAMGAVYLGEHLKIGRRDAIKVLRGQLAFDAETIARFNRGARNLSAIRHPNVCTLYDYGETADGSPFLALEFITGGTLGDLLRAQGTLPPARAVAIARQVALALEAAHATGIVHRDLKPANIMIEQGRDGSDIAKVVDFDIAKGPEAMGGDEVTRLGYVLGTPEYMSPEQLMGERLDGRSDIYSLGIVLFRMLTGMLPFQGGSTQAIMVERLTHAPLTLADVRPDQSFPPPLQTVLTHALALKRDDRYPDAATLARDLADPRLLQAVAGAPAAPQATAAGGGGAANSRLGATRHSPSPRGAAEWTPETRLGPPPPEGAPPAGTGAGGGKRRFPLTLVLAAAVVVIAGGTWAALSLFSPNPSRGGAGTQNPDPNAVAHADSPTVVQSASGGDGGRAHPQRRGGASTQTDTGQTAAGTRGDSGQATQGGGQPPNRGGGGATVLTDADAKVVLPRQLDYVPTDRMSSVGAHAVIDTALAYWDGAEISAPNKALAAYMLASAYLNLRDADNCDLWVDRALQLKPGARGYLTLKDLCKALRG